jgi:hypothetical protein
MILPVEVPDISCAVRFQVQVLKDNVATEQGRARVCKINFAGYAFAPLNDQELGW